MVWRIHFTADDLEQIQVRPTLGPLTEAVKAMSLFRCPRAPMAPFRPWLGQVKGRITAQMAALTALLPPGSPGRVGISLAAASQHASVLRDAGLITTHRQGSAVLHVLTPPGTELLQAG